MPRKPREVSPTGVYHFINRGVNKKHLFHKDGDYRYYWSLMREYGGRFGMEVYHYCLMVNHTHILLKAEDLVDLSAFGHFIQRRYAYYYCKTYKWSEQVFRKRFISIPIDQDGYLLECGRYIERNPLKANLVQDLRNYSYSSYSFYAFGSEDCLLKANPIYEDLGNSPEERRASYRDYVRSDRPYESLVDKAILSF